MKLKRRILE